jgi:hypothetical protein
MAVPYLKPGQEPELVSGVSQVWGGKICLPQPPEDTFTGKALPLPKGLRQPYVWQPMIVE